MNSSCCQGSTGNGGDGNGVDDPLSEELSSSPPEPPRIAFTVSDGSMAEPPATRPNFSPNFSTFRLLNAQRERCSFIMSLSSKKSLFYLPNGGEFAQ
jgi:hypothetical protein